MHMQLLGFGGRFERRRAWRGDVRMHCSPCGHACRRRGSPRPLRRWSRRCRPCCCCCWCRSPWGAARHLHLLLHHQPRLGAPPPRYRSPAPRVDHQGPAGTCAAPALPGPQVHTSITAAPVPCVCLWPAPCGGHQRGSSARQTAWIALRVLQNAGQALLAGEGCDGMTAESPRAGSWLDDGKSLRTNTTFNNFVKCHLFL